ncbi:CLUMA_CG006622, isoform A [Clunio marinus]|uniref:CLUMA_CG006622, isoform A n=1 Tax=Clunio marinus TaxID=568069 RepID=A0A1J1I3U7_9DIPT|nr:CLUMA_CG006622, isoform A [Clunio marinus]
MKVQNLQHKFKCNLTNLINYFPRKGKKACEIHCEKNANENVAKNKGNTLQVNIMQKENKVPSETYQYVGPYRLEKTLGKGQTGEFSMTL